MGLVLLSFVIIAYVFRYAPDLPFLGRRGSIHLIWSSHATLIVVTTIVALAAGAHQVRRGLAGVTQLRASLAAMHGGNERRVDERYVPEVQPLVDDLNALLDQREQAVHRALARAGDLAHGLKTPLALLAREGERAAAAGQPDLASAIEQQVARMRRHIDYHLAHARAAASGPRGTSRTTVQESVDGLVRTLLRLHADRQLAIDVHVSPSVITRAQREDLDEMLGNLLDNACKWTRGRVNVGASADAAAVTIVIDDDGPGLRKDLRTAVLQRGVRADEQVAGTGIGLAIVRDLVGLYGGAIELTESPLGGLRAVLTLPRG
jgi:signal transduction histidine kinase